MGTDGPFRSDKENVFFPDIGLRGYRLYLSPRSRPITTQSRQQSHNEAYRKDKDGTGKKGKTAYPAEGERLLLEHERCGDVDAVVRVDAEGRGRSGGVVLVDWSRRNRW